MKLLDARRISAIFIFILGLAIVFYPSVSQYINEQSASRLLDEYFATGGVAPIMDGGNGAADGASVADGSTDGASDDAVGVGRAAEGIFGSITIPKLELELPIYTGMTTVNLSKGIAHLEGTSLPVGGESTHSVLCGHNGAVMNEWFTHIDQLGEGDLFYVRTKEQYLTYKVVSMKEIHPDDTSDLYIREGEDLVTLLTCSKGGVMRLLVTGERVLDSAWSNG